MNSTDIVALVTYFAALETRTPEQTVLRPLRRKAQARFDAVGLPRREEVAA